MRISTTWPRSTTKVHDKANELSLEFASSFVGVPYHAGAVQYFADKGIEVPAE